MEIITLAIGPVAHSYVIREDNGSILVDTGCYTNKEEVEKEYAVKGIDPKEIKLIVLTHGHFDHCGGVDIAEELTGAPILCHKETLKFLEDGTFPPYQPRDAAGRKFIDEIAGPAPNDVPEHVDVTYVVGNEDFDLHPLGFNGKIIYTPGHINSAISLVMDSGDVFVGDTIKGHDFDESHYCCLAHICDDKEALYKSIERLLSCGHTFYSGHFGPFSKEEVEAACERSMTETL